MSKHMGAFHSFTFTHLADAFIQRHLQMRITQAEAF